MLRTHRRVNLLLDPVDVVVPDVNELIQFVDVELVILDDLSSCLVDL